MTQLGIPSAWGGGNATGPTSGFAQGAGLTGFDCSGVVIFAVAQATGGQTVLPHFADTQTRTGIPVSPDQLQPGDLICFTRAGETVAHHIGIYTGAGRMIHAPQTGSVVSGTSLSDPYGSSQSWRAHRMTG
jgi:cell wall-associated NlpC family hydrolase